jgi:hypothetical protein
MQNVKETDLAWALIDVAEPYLSGRERYTVFLTIGAGETFATILILLKLGAAKRIPLQTDLVKRCCAWADTYACHQAQPHLRRLIQGYSTPANAGAATTGGASRLPAAPKRLQPVGVNDLVGGAKAAS